MRFHLLEIDPVGLCSASEEAIDDLKFNFTIQPPIDTVTDSESINEAATRVSINEGFGNVTLGYSDKTVTYGSFEASWANCDNNVFELRRRIMKDAQLVFGAALGTAVDVVFPVEP